MCHWILHIWKCGDSFFTKYSSCSFDRAVPDPSNPLNPLHPSVVPLQVGSASPQDKLMCPRTALKTNTTGGAVRNKIKSKPTTTHEESSTTDMSGGTNVYEGAKAVVSPMEVRATHDAPTAAMSAYEAKTVYTRDVSTGKTIAIALAEVGKASRFGDPALSGGTKCNVFEVVLQSKEPTMCPACARSPTRASLPAHARGCFGVG